MYELNLVNEIHGRRKSVDQLSDIYNNEILSAIRRFRHKNISVDENSYFDFANSEQRLDHVSFEEFKALIEIQEKYDTLLESRPVGRASTNPGGEEGKFMRNQMRSITDKALSRRLAQDMCEDVSIIAKDDYNNLYLLGYRGEQDVAVPEIVRGNFKMYLDNQVAIEKIKRCQEILDRIEVFFRECPEGSSRGVQEYVAQRYLMGEVPMYKVRNKLKEHRVPPFVDYREKYLEELHREQFEKAKYTFDVHDEQGKIKKLIMDGNTEVSIETYKKLADLGYSGKDGHPLIKSGYQMYVDNYVYNKAIPEYSDDIEFMCWKLNTRPYAVKLLTDQRDIPDSVNAMSNLACDIVWGIAKAKYRRGKIGKEEYLAAKEWREELDGYIKPNEVHEAIVGVKEVDELKKKNLPPSR